MNNQDQDQNQMTEFQIVWCVVVAIALVTLCMDLFVWRP